MSGVCRFCGCTDSVACPGGCRWIDAEQTLCSACMKHLDRGTLDALAEEEIVSCAAVPVHVALTIADVAMLIETLQVALRHPEFPPLTSKAVSGWIQQVAAGVSQWTPAFHEIVMRSESPTLEASPIISSEESDS